MSSYFLIVTFFYKQDVFNKYSHVYLISLAATVYERSTVSALFPTRCQVTGLSPRLLMDYGETGEMGWLTNLASYCKIYLTL